MAIRATAWTVAYALSIVTVAGIASVGLLVLPFAFVAVFVALVLDRRNPEPFPHLRLFGVVLFGLVAVAAASTAVTELQSNECRPGLPYPCSDSKSEYLWIVVATASASGVIALIISAKKKAPLFRARP